MQPLTKDTGTLGMGLFSPVNLNQGKCESMAEETGRIRRIHLGQVLH